MTLDSIDREPDNTILTTFAMNSNYKRETHVYLLLIILVIIKYTIALQLQWYPDNSHKIRGKFVWINRACELSEQMINHILPYLQSFLLDDCVNNLVCAKKGGSNYPGSTVISLTHFIPDLTLAYLFICGHSPKITIFQLYTQFMCTVPHSSLGQNGQTRQVCNFKDKYVLDTLFTHHVGTKTDFSSDLCFTLDFCSCIKWCRCISCGGTGRCCFTGVQVFKILYQIILLFVEFPIKL